VAIDHLKRESGYQSLFQGGQFDDRTASALKASLAGGECMSVILKNIMRT
jgi:hypothetical protein